MGSENAPELTDSFDERQPFGPEGARIPPDQEIRSGGADDLWQLSRKRRTDQPCIRADGRSPSDRADDLRGGDRELEVQEAAPVRKLKVTEAQGRLDRA
jgi:hypothetical protein